MSDPGIVLPEGPTDYAFMHVLDGSNPADWTPYGTASPNVSSLVNKFYELPLKLREQYKFRKRYFIRLLLDEPQKFATLGEEHWNGVIGAVVDGTVIREPMELNQQYHYLCTKVRFAPSPMYKTLGFYVALMPDCTDAALSASYCDFVERETLEILSVRPQVQTVVTHDHLARVLAGYTLNVNSSFTVLG